MQNFFSKTILFFCLCAVLAPAQAQQEQLDKALAYMNKVTESQHQINSEMLGYMSAVAHDKSARKVSKRRNDAITAISSARAKALHMNDFDGDSALRVASYNYFNICYLVMKEDYAKIMDLEAISEQSYDDMEAYVKAQEAANQKESDAFAVTDKEMRAFAAKHNITITEDKSEESKQSEKVGKVTKYYNRVYLTFYRCNSNEGYMIKALDKKDINGIEQNKNALTKSSEEALSKLPEIGSFESDGSLITSCKKLLEFYQSEAGKKIPIMSDFIVKSDNFEKLKAAMEKNTSRSQSDIDEYNKSVKEMNAAATSYNKINDELNQTRGRLVDEWNNAYLAFMNRHIPHHK